MMNHLITIFVPNLQYEITNLGNVRNLKIYIFVNRYEAQKNADIATLQMENSILKSDKYTDEKSIELYKYVDGRFREFEQAIAQQAVYNATNTSTIACLQNQVACLQSLTKVVIPATSVCPEPMNRYNAFVAPTATPAT